ncbi:hypothetical protein VTL71DRAFT_15808 [Oculimacula yallundae]|uniref:2EXR domain-containing protein n=1 Tax=Oculimacula yallundae TaxID=86028 RepID=A0ABR4CDX8_9HELO
MSDLSQVNCEYVAIRESSCLKVPCTFPGPSVLSIRALRIPQSAGPCCEDDSSQKLLLGVKHGFPTEPSLQSVTISQAHDLMQSNLRSSDEFSDFSVFHDELSDRAQHLSYQWTRTPSFHPFPRLPTELRMKIWASSNRERRIVIGKKGVYGVPKFQCRSTVPPLLKVNHESRNEISKYYPYHTGSYGDTMEVSTSARFPFDPKVDVLVFKNLFVSRKSSQSQKANYGAHAPDFWARKSSGSSTSCYWDRKL